MAIEKAKIMTVTSVKGGTGKTTTVLNLAGIYSLKQKKVLIIDLDLYASAIAASLNIPIEQDLYKLIDDINNNRYESIESYLVSYNKNIDVLPAPKDPRIANKIGSKYLSIILSKVQYRYDVILIDTNYFMDAINLVALDFSDLILYIITNDPIDLKNMATRIALHKDMEQDKYKIVLNEAKDKQRNYFSKYDIKSIIKDDVDFVIPNSFYIKNIDKYILSGHILTLNKQIQKHHSKTIKVFEEITQMMENRK